MSYYTVNVDMSKLKIDSEAFVAALRNGTSPEMDRALDVAVAVYAGFVRRRFVGASGGDGTWLDLAYSSKLSRARALRPAASRGETVASRVTTRRKAFDRRVKRRARTAGISVAAARAAQVASMKFAVLRDTSNLFNSLTLGGPSNINARAGLRFTFGTTVRYADAHQTGTARLPARPFIVPPDPATMNELERIYEAGVAATLKAQWRK